MKKKQQKFIFIFTVLFFALFSFVVLANKVFAEGTIWDKQDNDYYIKMGIDNDTYNFTINSVTVNNHPWADPNDEFHTMDDQYYIVINVSANENVNPDTDSPRQQNPSVRENRSNRRPPKRRKDRFGR